MAIRKFLRKFYIFRLICRIMRKILSKKELVLKRIQNRHSGLIFINTKNDNLKNVGDNMNERDYLRIFGSSTPPVTHNTINNVIEHPIIINNDKKNLLFLITTYNRLEFLKQTIESWYKTINFKYGWTLIIADDNSTDGTSEYLENLKLTSVKIILIKNENRGVHHQENELFRIAAHLDFDYGFKSDDDVLFLNKGWDDLYINAIDKTGYDHLIYYDKTWGGRHKEVRESIFKDDILENCVDAKNLQGAFWTFTPRVIKSVGYVDIENFNLTGIGHIDRSFRCCRLGFNDINNPFDVKNSNDYIKLNYKNYYSTIEPYQRIWNSKDKLEKKYKMLNDDRTFIPYNEMPVKMNNKSINENFDAKLVSNNNEINYINKYYDHIYCLNLDRRKDRWQNVKNRLDKLNIIAERFSAIDGYSIPENVLKQYTVKNTYVVGCMMSHYKIIEDAKKNNYRRILILEDDVIFINDFHKKFLEMTNKIKDWKLLYLGGTQFEWNKIEYTENFYKPKNTDGTFAYSISSDVYDEILDTVKVTNMPIDTKLHAIQKKYYNSSYVCNPNLIICDVSDSDIRKSSNNKEFGRTMKWNLNNYNISSEITNKKRISIIVTAYKTENYIEECLDSIQNQTYFINNDNYEILLGIDSCYETLYKVAEIRDKYKNLRIFMMKSNLGTYVTTNTLIDYVTKNSKYILRFDSDDVMMPEMIEKIMNNIDNNDIVKFKFFDFKDDTENITNTVCEYPHGILLYNKNVFNIAGGYKDWKCAADTEFLNRINKYVKIKELDECLFYRRIHENSLTNSNETGYNSELREKYRNMIIENNDENVKINKTVNKCIEIK